jgi:hypothetical protein
MGPLDAGLGTEKTPRLVTNGLYVVEDGVNDMWLR